MRLHCRFKAPTASGALRAREGSGAQEEAAECFDNTCQTVASRRRGGGASTGAPPYAAGGRILFKAVRLHCRFKAPTASGALRAREGSGAQEEAAECFDNTCQTVASRRRGGGASTGAPPYAAGGRILFKAVRLHCRFKAPTASGALRAREGSGAQEEAAECFDNTCQTVASRRRGGGASTGAPPCAAGGRILFKAVRLHCRFKAPTASGALRAREGSGASDRDFPTSTWPSARHHPGRAREVFARG